MEGPYHVLSVRSVTTSRSGAHPVLTARGLSRSHAGPAAVPPEPTRCHCGIGVDFAERQLWNIGAVHSGLMPANLITLAHFSVSFAMNFPKSAGVIGIGTPPRSASRALILGSARPALNSLLSLSTISAGVPFGAPTPYQVLAS